MTENYFKQDVKRIVDMLFDSKSFHAQITRDDMNAVEDLLCYLLQSKYDSYIRCTSLLQKIKHTETPKASE